MLSKTVVMATLNLRKALLIYMTLLNNQAMSLPLVWSYTLAVFVSEGGLLLADPSHLPGIGRDASESSLMNSMIGSGLYVDQSSSQRALSPEDVEPLMDISVHHADAASLEKQLAQQQLQSLDGLSAQQPPAHLSTQISMSSDTAQNTCVPVVAGSGRNSGDASVNDHVSKPEETIDDIMRFFLKVGCGCCVPSWQLAFLHLLGGSVPMAFVSTVAVCQLSMIFNLLACCRMGSAAASYFLPLI